MSIERSEVDMIFLGLTIYYVYLLTIGHLYNFKVNVKVYIYKALGFLIEQKR